MYPDFVICALGQGHTKSPTSRPSFLTSSAHFTSSSSTTSTVLKSRTVLYQRLLDYIKPTYVHVLRHGKIILSGGPELALKLEEQGYDWIEEN